MRRNKALQVIAHLVKWYEEPPIPPEPNAITRAHEGQLAQRHFWETIVMPMFEAHKDAKPWLDYK